MSFFTPSSLITLGTDTLPLGTVSDEVLLKAPQLLIPKRHPLGPVKLNKDHPAARHMVGGWPLFNYRMNGIVRDLCGQNHGYPLTAPSGITPGPIANEHGMGCHIDGDTTVARIRINPDPIAIYAGNQLSCNVNNEISIFTYATHVKSNAVYPNGTGNSYPRIIDKSSAGSGANGYAFVPTTNLASTVNTLSININTTALVYSNADIITPGVTHAMGVTARSGDIDFWVDGVITSNHTDTFTIPTGNVNASLLNWNSASGDRQWAGTPVFVIYVWDIKVDPSVMIELARNPYGPLIPA